MHDQQTFLEAIRASPDDAACRLVFSDWLDEHDKPCWAAAIRQQVRSHRRDPDGLDEGWYSSVWRTYAPFFSWRETPDAERLAAEMGYPVHFEVGQLAGGLVGQVTLDAADFLEVGPALVAWGPVPALTLINVEPHAESLAQCPALAGVTALDLGGASLTDDGFRTLLRSPHLGRVTDLNLGKPWDGAIAAGNVLTASAFRRLSHTKTLSVLERLCLDGNQIGDDRLAALAEGPALRGLTALSLQWCYLTGAGFLPWAEKAPWPNLRHLNLFGNPLQAGGAEALAQSPQLATLWSLRLAGTGFSDNAARLLGRSPHSTQLRDLDLSMSAVGDDGFIALADSPALGELRRLRLHYTSPEGQRRPRIHSRGGEALGRAAFAQRLRVLDLNKQAIGNAGLAALAQSVGYESLERLELAGNGIGDGGAIALSRAHLSRLTYLKLSGNQLTDAGVRVLAGSPYLAALQELVVFDNPITDAGALALAESPWPDLRKLHLDESNLSPDGVNALRERFGGGVRFY
jgi:uncharacterized protein (TIGR02996 family)